MPEDILHQHRLREDEAQPEGDNDGDAALLLRGEPSQHAKIASTARLKVSHQTVYNWISKYVSLMERYLDKITPQVGETWRADEIFVKFSGKMNYVFAMMDDETRFWIAHQ